MKTPLPGMLLRRLAPLLSGICLACAPGLRAAFVYESANEFFTSGDFNGDGIPDVLVLDKLTGNARVGYSDGSGNLNWSAPLVTGVENVTGCGVEPFLQPTKDAVAVTAPGFNHVSLVDLSQTNAAGSPQTFTPPGLGPRTLAGLRSPQAPPSGGLPFLLVASSLNDAPAERLDLAQWTGAPVYYGQFAETGSFDRANALDINSNTATFAVGVVRGQTNDALHLWQFTNSPGVMLAYSNLPAGSDYTFGNFNGELLPRFVFYQPGGSNVSLVPLLQTNSGYGFGASLNVGLSEAVENVCFLANGTNGAAIIQFNDGIRGLTLPNGSPLLSPKYQAGAGAAGNVFTGVVPLANGQFALLDAPAGAGSAHAQVVKFDGTNFTQLSASNLPLISSRTSRANVWLFQLEPFVNRSPGFIASLNSPDWSDGVGGLPGAIQVPTENDAGATNGLGSVSTNNLGAPPSGAAFGIGNQYQLAISLFSYSAPRAAEAIDVTISPPPGPYGSPLAVSLTVTPSGSGARYRVGDADSWHPYSAQFLITNDATIEFYGTNSLGARSSLQVASYSLGNPATGGTNSPIVISPGDTNSVGNPSTNEIVLSPNGTVFYGRVSAASNYTIWAINLDGSSDTFITTGARPRVSRDGRYLVFLRDGSPLATQGNLWVRDLVTGAETQIETNSYYTVGYDWDLTETNVVFDNSCELWSLGVDGGVAGTLPIPSPSCYDAAPAVNPVDGSLAFHNLDPDTNIGGLYVTTPALNSKQRLDLGVTGASWPSWSPDGGWLAFADGNNAGAATTADDGTNLWIVRSDGAGLTQISGFSDGTNRFPHGVIWTPDGSALVGAGTIFGTNGLWVIPLTPDYTDCDGPPILLPTTPGDSIDFAGSIVVAPSGANISVMPGLFIRQTADAVVVYWSTNFAGFTLESATNLGAPTPWSAITGPYVLSGNDYQYWESKSSLLETKFFRLHYTGAFIVSQLPALSIRWETNSVAVSWQTNWPAFILQSKTDLSLPWNDITGPYPINGGVFEFQEPDFYSSPRRFYRLRGP
jgi:WD40-like Beta Propeller Repeat